MLSYRYFPVPNQRIQNDRNPMYNPCQSEFPQTGGRLFANYMYEVLHTTQSQQVSASLKDLNSIGQPPTFPRLVAASQAHESSRTSRFLVPYAQVRWDDLLLVATSDPHALPRSQH